MNQEAGKKTLRFAIMCDDFLFPEWKAACISELISLPDVQAALIINKKEEKPVTRGNSSLPPLFYRALTRFFFKFSTDKKKDMSEFFKGLPLLECKPILKGRFSQYFSDEDIQAIDKYKCDFILRFGFNILRGKILDVAKYGVWSYHHCDEMKYRGGPAGIMEILHNDPVTAVVLQRLTERLDGGIILKKYFFKTINHSYAETTETIFRNSTAMPKQVCIDIMNGSADYFDKPPSTTDAKVNTYPGNFTLVLFLVKLFINKLRFHFHDLFIADQWRIGIVKNSIQSFINKGFIPKVNWLFSVARDKYAADPFGYRLGEKQHIIFEDYSYRNEKGKIVSAIVEESPAGQLSITNIQSSIELPTHLSYPFIIEHESEIYCLPENHEANELNIYQLDKTQQTWNKKATLLKGIAAVDSTLIRWEGRWWLFFTDKNKLPNAQLFIYHSENLFEQWQPHDNNPVKTDIRSARCAGNIFEYNGFLYRPSQDCSITSGGKIRVNKINVLTPKKFEEETVHIIEPPQNTAYTDGIHTLSKLGDYTVLDSKRFVFSWANFMHKMKTKIM